MKKLRSISAIALLTVAFSIPVLAGDMDTPGRKPCASCSSAQSSAGLSTTDALYLDLLLGAATLL